MKRCPTCVKDLTGTHGKVRFCSSTCRDAHSNSKKSLLVRLAAVIDHTNCSVCGCPHLTKRADARFCSRECRWEHTNRSRTTGFWKLRYHSRMLPEVDRILRIISRTPEWRRSRLADLLLYRGGSVLTHHEVDYFLADYNTKGA